jgi:hypothetical protein
MNYPMAGNQIRRNRAWVRPTTMATQTIKEISRSLGHGARLTLNYRPLGDGRRVTP